MKGKGLAADFAGQRQARLSGFEPRESDRQLRMRPAPFGREFRIQTVSKGVRDDV